MAAILAVIVVTAWVGYRTYSKLSRFVDAKLQDGTLGAHVMLYTAPRKVAVGDETSPELIASELRAAGFSDRENSNGTYAQLADGLVISSGPNSYPGPRKVTIRFKGNQVSGIEAEGTGKMTECLLEPQPLATMEGGSLGRRRLVRYSDIPKPLIHALLSAEDKHFFHHAGFDPPRVVKAAIVNLRRGRKEQGGSTITMQLARNLYLDADKTWKRKATELLIAGVLEWKLTKEQIFENYTNFVYLGRSDSMDVRGFAQASETFLGKPLSRISVADAALLAGLVQRPSYYDPIRHPERAVGRRNVVLRLMRQNGYIDDQQMAAARSEAIPVPKRTPYNSTAPWFLDLALNQLEAEQPEELRGRVYTTLDPDLQRAASEAVEEGMRALDKRLRRRNTTETPQVALVALDSHTGEVKAVIGGRDFNVSQLNHALCMRQPGSAFKPFVYASALDAQDHSKRLSAASTVEDVPTSFEFRGKLYEPSNFGDQFYGTVTLRRALAKSMNIATISIAEQVGYSSVLDIARRAGLNDRMQATPSLALGAYEATPLEMAASYTIFANQGDYVKPTLIQEIRSMDGNIEYQAKPMTRHVLSKEGAWLMQDLLSEVIRTGTAAAAGHKLRGPAAGKTGTSRDGWFVGYTSNLICAVWIGYDSNQDLNLEGSKSALPVWLAFMTRAGKRKAYRQDLGPVPKSIVSAVIDADTGLLAGPNCPARREFFIAGTQPSQPCPHEFIEAVPPTTLLTTGLTTTTPASLNSPQ